MIFDFNDVGVFDIFNVAFEIEFQGNTTIQTMGAPQMIVQNQFVNLVEQAANTKFPCRVKMTTTVQVYNEFEHCLKDIEHFMEFKNNAYLDNE